MSNVHKPEQYQNITSNVPSDPKPNTTKRIVDASSNPHERWSRMNKPRGRQPRDPNAQSVIFHSRNVTEMENFLKEYLEAPSIPAEHATIEFTFPVSAAFMVYSSDLKDNGQSNRRNEQTPLRNKLDRTVVSVMEALASAEDPKDSMRRQKAIAKVCVEACEKADGYRYSFHNNWLSREEGACRFSYFCNDSTLNKGRAANEGAGMSGKRKRKPAYDCQGLVAVKFSATSQHLQVHYKHVPLHTTYASRAPIPRKDSKRRKMVELLEPEKLAEGRKRPTDSITTERQKPKSGSGRIVEKDTVMDRLDDQTATVIRASEVHHSTRLDSLQPIVEFLGSTNRTPVQVDTTVETSGDLQCDTTHEASGSPARNGLTAITVVGRSAQPGRATGPPITADSVRIEDSNQVSMIYNSSSQLMSHARQSDAQPNSLQSDRSSDTPQHGVIQSAIPSSTSHFAPVSASTKVSVVGSSIALTEIEAIKRELETAKRDLEAAEARIKRLESEKSAPWSYAPHSSGSQQPDTWSPSSGHVYQTHHPHPYQASGPLALYHSPRQPEQVSEHPPPQGSPDIRSIESRSISANAPSQATPTATTAPTKSRTSPANFKQSGRKFVLYTPGEKEKKSATRKRQAASRTTPMSNDMSTAAATPPL